MSEIPRPRALYLDAEPDPLFATLHRPAARDARGTGVLLCPPFGWEEVCSYRSLRAWGQALSGDGYPALRISLPATGDSGGSARDPDRVGAWTRAVRDGAAWLRHAGGARRVVAIGIGLGGMMACSAAGAGAPIDDLVLWGVPARGRSLLRALRAFSKLEISLFYDGLPPPPPLPEGELEAGGFLLSTETIRALEALDLTDQPLPNPRSRRVLLLGRDGIAADSSLRDHFEELGVQLTTAPGNGFAAMSSHPQEAVAPSDVIAHVSQWLSKPGPPPEFGSAEPVSPAPNAQPSARMILGDDVVIETPVSIPQTFGDLSGILVEPQAHQRRDLCVLLLNAGAVRRTGPGRLWVQAARDWAIRGVTTLRLDVEGIGDSDGDASPYRDDGALYAPGLVPQVISAIDYLQRQGLGERFALGGLCAGAYWSFHAALSDDRVCAALMLNPRALVWDSGLGPSRDLRALLSERPSLSRLRRVATGGRIKALLGWLLRAPLRWLHPPGGRKAGNVDDEVDHLLERLLASNKRALFVFSAHEPLQAELVSSGRIDALQASPQVVLDYVAVRDHTMRPYWAQQQVLETLNRVMDRELAADGGAQGLNQKAVSE